MRAGFLPAFGFAGRLRATVDGVTSCARRLFCMFSSCTAHEWRDVGRGPSSVSGVRYWLGYDESDIARWSAGVFGNCERAAGSCPNENRVICVVCMGQALLRNYLGVVEEAAKSFSLGLESQKGHSCLTRFGLRACGLELCEATVSKP